MSKNHTLLAFSEHAISTASWPWTTLCVHEETTAFFQSSSSQAQGPAAQGLARWARAPQPLLSSWLPPRLYLSTAGLPSEGHSWALRCPRAPHDGDDKVPRPQILTTWTAVHGLCLPSPPAACCLLRNSRPKVPPTCPLVRRPGFTQTQPRTSWGEERGRCEKAGIT